MRAANAVDLHSSPQDAVDLHSSSVDRDSSHISQQVVQASGQGAVYPATTRLDCSVSKTQLLNGLEVCVCTL